MISVRVNEIFNYLSTDRKKVHDQCRQLGRVANEQQRNAGSTSGKLGAVVENPEGGCSNSKAPLEQQVEDTDHVHALLSSSSLEDIEPESLKNDIQKLNCKSSVVANQATVTTQDHAVELKETKRTVGLTANISNSPKVKTKASRDKSKPLKNGAVFSDKCTAESSSKASFEPVGCVSEKDSSVSQFNNVCNQPVRSSHDNIKPCSSSQASSRNRKKNRRNEDRSSSAVTLDMRSSCGKTNEGGSSSVKKLEHSEHRVEAKLVGNSGRKISNSQFIERSKQCKSDVSTRQQACVDVFSDVADAHGSKTNLEKGSGIAGLDTFEMDGLLKAIPPAHGGILDSSKIDALDSFDDFVSPSHYCSKAQSSVNATDDQWTEVNRRFKRVIMTSETFECISGTNGFNLNCVVQESGAHIEIERQNDKVIVVIKGNNDQIQSAYNLITELANRPVSRERSIKKHRGRSTGCRSKGKNMPPRAVFDSCQVRVADTSKISLDSVVNAVASSSSLMSSHSSEMMSSKPGCPADQTSENDRVSPCRETRADRTVPPTPVKEYSLFDNIFSRTVEQVLSHKDSPSSVLSSRSSIYPMTSPFVHSYARQSNAAVDQALLAKAPGYRSSPPAASINQFSTVPDLPFHLASDILWERRVRKYSDSSSSGRSSEDSGVGGCVTNNGFSLPPNAGSSSTVFDLLVGNASEKPPPGYQTWYPQGHHCSSNQLDDIPGSEDYLVTRSRSSNTQVGLSFNREEQYSIPDKPMTLPRIASDLNPNAPDFVFYPQHVNDTGSLRLSHFAERTSIPPVQQTICSSFVVPSVTDFISDSGAIGSERKKFNDYGTKTFLDVNEFPPLASRHCETLQFECRNPVADFCQVGLQY